jgi:hypothetical protein
MDDMPLVVVVDVDYTLMLIGLAWFAILAMLAGGAVVELLVRRPEKAPFFGVLERLGLTLFQAEQAAGLRGIGEAASRCASCGVRAACRRALRWGGLGFTAPPCPNASFFAQVAQGSKP